MFQPANVYPVFTKLPEFPDTVNVEPPEPVPDEGVGPVVFPFPSYVTV